VRLEVRPFETAHIADAGRLLAARHRAGRAIEPALDPAYEDPAGAAREIEALLAREGTAGVAATRKGTLVGYLLGTPGDKALWGANMWIESAGHAVLEADTVRDLYAAIAGSWVADGRVQHYAIVPAADRPLVDAWFSVEFGQQHLLAIREAPGPSFAPTPRAGVSVRRAEERDIEALADLELVLPAHLRGSPVFSSMASSTRDEARTELERDIHDPRLTFSVAEHDGRVIGTSLACSIDVSSMYRGLLRPIDAGLLAYAAVFPEARGLGAGGLLGETVLAWARDAGYRWVAVDWRSGNLEAGRAWTRLGFRPTFRRLHRAIV